MGKQVASGAGGLFEAQLQICKLTHYVGVLLRIVFNFFVQKDRAYLPAFIHLMLKSTHFMGESTLKVLKRIVNHKHEKTCLRFEHQPALRYENVACHVSLFLQCLCFVMLL